MKTLQNWLFEDSVDQKTEIEQANGFVKAFKTHRKAFKGAKKFKISDELAAYYDRVLLVKPINVKI